MRKIKKKAIHHIIQPLKFHPEIVIVQSMEDDSDDKSLKFLDNALSKNELPNNPIFDNIIKDKYIYY